MSDLCFCKTCVSHRVADWVMESDNFPTIGGVPAPPDPQEYRFTVHYQYADYSGRIVVFAQTREGAIGKAKRQLAPHMSLPMAYESYQIESAEPI